MKEELNLKNLKKDYKILQKKYSLPDFDKLNEDFGIERVADVETDFLLREIRKFLADRIYAYLRFIEGILNPINATMFIFSIIKTLNGENKKKLSAVYKKLSRLEVDLLEIDLYYSADKESNFIKESFKIWQEMKEEILEVIKTIKSRWNDKSKVNGGEYFG